MTPAELSEKLWDNAERVAKYLLPRGHLEGKEWCAGNTNGDGASNNNGWTTTTPIPDSPSLDDLFYQNEKIPGLENVRPENPGYPANQSVIEKMNEPKFIAWIGNTDCTDCSDIAPKLLDAAGEIGRAHV